MEIFELMKKKKYRLLAAISGFSIISAFYSTVISSEYYILCWIVALIFNVIFIINLYFPKEEQHKIKKESKEEEK